MSCEPVSQYDVAFPITLPVLWSNKQVSTPDKLGSVMLNRAFKESAKLGKSFDAIIITSGKRDIAITFKE